MFSRMKTAIYCRLSEEDRNKQSATEDSGSIQNQKTMLSQYAMEQGWDIYRIYRDDDYTGSCLLYTSLPSDFGHGWFESR